MMLNINQGDATIIQKFVTHFLPTIADAELGERPTHYFFEIKDPIWNGWFGLKTFDTQVFWEHIEYTDADIELDKIKFGIENWEGHGLFSFDFPAYKNLIIKAE